MKTTEVKHEMTFVLPQHRVDDGHSEPQLCTRERGPAAKGLLPLPNGFEHHADDGDEHG